MPVAITLVENADYFSYSLIFSNSQYNTYLFLYVLFLDMTVYEEKHMDSINQLGYNRRIGQYDPQMVTKIIAILISATLALGCCCYVTPK